MLQPIDQNPRPHVATWLVAGVTLVVTSATWAGPWSDATNADHPASDAGIHGLVGGAPNPAFVAWASGVESYSPVGTIDAKWTEPGKALGAMTADHTHVVSLGDLASQDIAAGVEPGSITLTFETLIYDGEGPDLAVFENALGTATSLFAELGYVEVSTDGVHFARFDSISRTPAPTSPQSHLYLPVDPTGIYNLAGKHANGNGHDLGTPFDLAELAEHDLVRQGLLSVNRIEYVRIVDVVGSGDFLDSRGEPIYDAWPTWGSGGFDLEAIGALHAAELGDWNRDGTIDATDLDALGAGLQAGSTDLVFDYNSDGSVDREDLRAILADRFGAGPADANLDGVVDPADLQLLRDHFGRAGGWGDGDVSLDGQVDFADYVLLARHWGDQAPLPPLSVPEPSALTALLTAGLVAAGRRRRR